MTNEDLAAAVKAWRGKVPAREAAEILGISKRTLDGVEQGRGFNYPSLLLHALRTIPIEGKMPRTRTPHLNVETRNGVTKYYFRKGNGPRIRINHDYGAVEFWAEYRSLLGGQPVKIDVAEEVEQDTIRCRFPRRIEYLLVQCQQRAIANRRDFDLNLEWLINQFEHQDYRCALTGLPFQAGRSEGIRMNPFAPSLDRIDCARGYTKDNVRLILASVNVALNDFGLSHFDRIAVARMQQIVKERHAA